MVNKILNRRERGGSHVPTVAEVLCHYCGLFVNEQDAQEQQFNTSQFHICNECEKQQSC